MLTQSVPSHWNTIRSVVEITVVLGNGTSVVPMKLAHQATVFAVLLLFFIYIIIIIIKTLPSVL